MDMKNYCWVWCWTIVERERFLRSISSHSVVTINNDAISLTWTMTMETKMNIEQMATAAIGVKDRNDLIWSVNLPSCSLRVEPSIRAASALKRFVAVSSLSCDNCFSAAILRFPAGDELMHSPESNKIKTENNEEKFFQLTFLLSAVSVYNNLAVVVVIFLYGSIFINSWFDFVFFRSFSKNHPMGISRIFFLH